MISNQEDKIISEFLESIGPWRELIVIGGGFALFIHSLHTESLFPFNKTSDRDIAKAKKYWQDLGG